MGNFQDATDVELFTGDVKKLIHCLLNNILPVYLLGWELSCNMLGPSDRRRVILNRLPLPARLTHRHKSGRIYLCVKGAGGSRLSPFSLSLTVLPPGGSALEPSQVPHWPLGFSDRCSVSVGNGQGGKGHPAAGDSRRVNFGSR